MYEQSHRDYLRSGYLHHHRHRNVWAVNHYRDNAITYKAQRDKNARELKLANAAITDMQMRQRDVAALDAKYTKELADAKAENDALRDGLALGVVDFYQEASPARRTMKPPPPPAWMWLLPEASDFYARTGYFAPLEEADHYAKTTSGRNPEVY